MSTTFTKPMGYSNYAIPAMAAYGMSKIYAGTYGPPGRKGPGGSIGANRSLVARRSHKRKGRKSFKRAVMDIQPAKHVTSTPNTSMTHNTLYTCCPSQAITQGDGNTNRDGDSAYLCALKMKGVFYTSTLEGGYQYRIIVGYSGEEISTANVDTTFVSGLGTSEVFLPNTATAITSNGIINPKAFTVLYDETFDVNSQLVDIYDSIGFDFTVPLNTQLPYQASGSVFGKYKNLYVLVMGWIGGGSSGVSAVGNVSASYDLIFK